MMVIDMGALLSSSAFAIALPFPLLLSRIGLGRPPRRPCHCCLYPLFLSVYFVNFPFCIKLVITSLNGKHFLIVCLCPL